jgi:hypothetical protein
MRRWPAQILVKLAQYPMFWKMRRFWDKLTFYVKRFLFNQREALRVKREEANTFIWILRSVLWYTCIVGSVIFLLEVLEHFIIARQLDFGWLQRTSSNAYASTDYALQTLTGVQGVFLAVYFTAVSVVAGAIYAEVPHEVRQLLARDRLGNFFIKFIAACAAASVLLLGVRGLGWSTGKLPLILSVLAGCYSIFAIFVVLKNSITLFDPGRVGDVIFHDITRAARSASIEGFAWDNIHFQVGYSNQAAQSLKALRMVVDVCVEKSGSGNRPLSNLMNATLRVWAVYAYFRARIPVQSRWYRSLVRHKRWLLTQEMEVSLALNTQTTLQAELRKDHAWVEAEFLTLLERGLTALLDRNDVVATHERLGDIASLVGVVARQLDTTQLRSFQTLAFNLAEHWSQCRPKKDGVQTARYELEEIGIIDSLGFIPL